MWLITVQSRDFIQFAQLPVDTDLGVAALAHLFQELLVMTLSATHQRSKKITFAPGIIIHDQRDYLLVAVSDHGLAGLRRISCRGSGIKKSQEVVYFRNSTHRRTGVVAGSLLLYGDYRAETCDGLHLRLFQNAHEMLGIGGERVHIAALAFSINSVEGKGRLAAAAEAGHYDELPTGNRKRHILQVMGLGTFDLYIIVLFLHLPDSFKQKTNLQKILVCLYFFLVARNQL